MIFDENQTDFGRILPNCLNNASKPGEFAPVDFPNEVIDIKIDYNQLFISK